LISFLCHCTGWTWDQVAYGLDWPRVQAMTKQWESHPPLCLMVQSYLGIKPKTEQTTANADELMQALAMFPQG
jgi:hypothetical protein